MRKVILFIAVCLLAGTTASYAQLTKEQRKERKEITKASKSELNEKASKAARKESKSMKKEGWQVAPGALPMEKQLDRSYMMQYEYDEEMYPKYIMGEAMSIVDEYTMTCSREVEFNDIYVIFSPNPFTKANANESDKEVLPKQLSYEDFQKWLVKNRKKDNQISIVNKQIKIQQL